MKVAVIGAICAMMARDPAMGGISINYKPERDVKPEPLKPDLTREDFPSRQAYRAYMRAWAKQGAQQ